jgi:hypothetical protein
VIVAELLKKLNNISDDVDVYIADRNITTWPIQIPIDKVEFDEKNKTVYLLTADTQSIPPQSVIEALTYNT